MPLPRTTALIGSSDTITGSPEEAMTRDVLFETFVETSAAPHMEIQSSDLLLAAMLHTYARDVSSEAIVFRDGLTTALPANGAVLEQVTSDKEIRCSINERAGGGQWLLKVEGQQAGNGGILFHYNPPYGDIYMEIDEPFRAGDARQVSYENDLFDVPGGITIDDRVFLGMQAAAIAGFVPVADIRQARGIAVIADGQHFTEIRAGNHGSDLEPFAAMNADPEVA